MKMIDYIRRTAVLLSFVLLGVAFSACDKTPPKPDTPPTPKPEPVKVSSVALDKTSLSLLVGGYEMLSATVSPNDAANKEISWSSSDASIAKVDGTGKVTGEKVGSAVITVTSTDGAKKATCNVTIAAAEDLIELGGFDNTEW